MVTEPLNVSATAALVAPAEPGLAPEDGRKHFGWSDYGQLSLDAVVSLPLQQLTLGQVAALAPGAILRSVYHVTDDLFLSIHGVPTASVTLEPAGLTRGTRITNFTPRVPAFAPAAELSPAPGAAIQAHLRDCRVPLSLCFGSRTMLLADAMQLVPGQLLSLDTLLNDPVTLTIGPTVIAYGTPMLQANFYCILLTRMAGTAPTATESQAG